MSVKHYLFILLLFCTGSVWAQSFVAQASKTQVATGEQFEVSFTINANGTNFTAPNFNGFEVVGGPNQSTSMSYVNGNMSQSVSLSYDLVASKEGTFTIGPASVESNGKRLTTQPLTIKVVKGAPVQQNAGQAQGGAPDNSTAVSASPDMSKNLFIRAELDKSHVYVGQQLTLSFKLYRRASILDYSVDKEPDLNGFWNQEIKPTTQGNFPTTETVNGQQYLVNTLKQNILFPERSGDLIIDPYDMTFVVRVVSAPRNAMEQMFGGSYKDVKVKIKSLPVVVHVKPLPDAGKPAGFTGAVGSFSIAASVDKTELKANEAMNYKLKISGSGNIKLLKDVNINPPADFEKYDPKIIDTVDESLKGVSGSRFLTYLMIPRHEGNYTIDPVQFSYFNPATGRYITLTTKAFPIKVNKGEGGSNVTTLAPSDQRDIKMLSKDIRYIKTTGLDLYKDDEGFFGSAGFYLLLLLGPLAFAGAFVYRRYTEEQNSDIVKVKNRRAAKLAAKHMADAQKQLQAGDKKAFYEAVSKGLYGYLSDKLNIPAANLDQENIKAGLEARKLDEAIIARLMNTLDLCEMARFAPVSGVSQQEVFEGARTTINDIETRI